MPDGDGASPVRRPSLEFERRRALFESPSKEEGSTHQPASAKEEDALPDVSSQQADLEAPVTTSAARSDSTAAAAPAAADPGKAVLPHKWQSPNVFQHCVSVQLHAVRALPGIDECATLVFEIKAQKERHEVALSLDRLGYKAPPPAAAPAAAATAGGGAAAPQTPPARVQRPRPPGPFGYPEESLSDRIDIMTTSQLPELELKVTGHHAGRWWLVRQLFRAELATLRLPLRRYWARSPDGPSRPARRPAAGLDGSAAATAAGAAGEVAAAAPPPREGVPRTASSLSSAEGAPRWHASSSIPREQSSAYGQRRGVIRRLSWDASLPTPANASQGPALLLSVRCFKPANLESPSSVRRVFTTYAGEGDAATMAVTDFERLSADWSAARAIAHGRGRVLFRGAAAASAPLTMMLGGCKRALGWATETGLAGCACYRPNCSMVAYMMYYHTILWVICRPKEEQHIPVLHRLYLVLLSLGFNLLLCVAFFASDFSLVAIHCVNVNEDNPGAACVGANGNRLQDCALQHCTPLQEKVWQMADVLLVAVIDVLLWPALKAVFFVLHDPECAARLARVPDRARLVLKGVLVGALVLGLILMLVHAWRYAMDAVPVLSEFFQTWPAARITEVFKLMSFWGLLLEYGPPEPEPDSDEDDAPGAPTPHTPGIYREAYTPVKPEERKGDPKRVALLSDAR